MKGAGRIGVGKALVSGRQLKIHGSPYATVSSGTYCFRWDNSGGHLFGSGSVKKILMCFSWRFSNASCGIIPSAIMLNLDLMILGDDLFSRSTLALFSYGSIR
jgi:hypothetical protein